MLNKNLPRFLIELESKKRSEKMYERFIQISTQGPQECHMKKNEAARKNNIESNESAGDNRAKNIMSKPYKEAMRILGFWLNSANIFLSQTDLLIGAGVKGGAKGSKIKKILTQSGLITVHLLQKGRGFLSIWEPTGKAYQITGISKPQYPSKGGYLHQFVTNHSRQWAKQHGYTVEIEFVLSNNKAVDLTLRKENKLIFVEIAISPPPEKEISNIIKDFSTELIPEKLIIACKNGKMKKTLLKLIKEDDRLDDYRRKIEVILAGDFIQINSELIERDNKCIG